MRAPEKGLRVLVAGEDPALRARLAQLLEASGYVVAFASAERRGLLDLRNLGSAIVAPRSFDPKGLALARELCAGGCRVIVLTDSREAVERVSRVLPDADPFPVQPLDERRLLRLVADIAAARAVSTTVLQFEGRTLDLEGRAFIDEKGCDVPLTRAEFELLGLLARCSGRVLSRDQLRHGISGRDHDAYDRSIDMLVARLRRKIEPNAKTPRFILTVPGAGYKFVARVQRADVATAAPIEPQQAEARNAGCGAERRQVSILACQIRGLAAISAKLDLEDQGELMSSVRRACADVAAGFGGVMAGTLGDSVVIYFGCKEAQEHDPERAVRAALDLVDAIRNIEVPGALHTHIGVATGIMLVGAPSGSGEELAATGQALNIALRLQSAAPSDSVLITDRTRELVGDFFDCRAMEPLVLADDLPLVAVWRVTGESAKAGRFEALRRAGMHELVGRRSQMQLLRRGWSRVLDGGGQIVLVTGEPGIGKSRPRLDVSGPRSAGLVGSVA